jgi:hypothetical protein
MKVFIGWSGDKSEQIARYLQKWLKKVLPEVDILVSFTSPAGKQWFNRLSARLDEADYGIFCLTKDNMEQSPWIYFEAGAIAHRNSWENVIALLFDFEPNALGLRPFYHFTAILYNRAEVKRMLLDLSDSAELNEANTELLFQKHWPSLYSKFRANQNDSTIRPIGALSSRTRLALLKRSRKRADFLLGYLMSGAPVPSRNWTKDESREETKRLREAEVDDEIWPLEIGDKVSIQLHYPDPGNGMIGTVSGLHSTPHCYIVRFVSDDSEIERKYNALYLTRIHE